MIETKYGDISNFMFSEYKNSLVNNVYKILPMKEEGTHTIDKYIESLIHELIGAKEILKCAKNKSDIVTVIFVLENLIKEQDIQVVRREVFKTINIIKRM